MPQARRNQVHHQRLPLLQPGFGLQRRGCRGCRAGECERVQDRLDEPEPQLGSKLAVKLCFGWSVTFLQGHRQWPTFLHLVEHSPGQLAVRSDFHRKEFPSLIPTRNKSQHFFLNDFPAILLYFHFYPLLAPFCWVLLLTGCWRMWKCFRDKFDFLIGGFWCDLWECGGSK